MATTTPIKRSESLAPLSREHHESLLLNWKIKQGLRLNVERSAIVDYCKWFFANHMVNHFRKEEVELTKLLPKQNLLMARMFDEHKLIKEQIELLHHNSPDSELLKFGEMVNDHVRFEERQLFQLIEEVATEDQLLQIAVALTEKIDNGNWENEFWITKKKA